MPLVPLQPLDAPANDWAPTVTTMQRYRARVGQPQNPEDCVRYYRSSEMRNRMPTSRRLKAIRTCTAANEAKSSTRVADTVRPDRPVSFRLPVPRPVPAPAPVVVAPATPN
jgi:hypothetical protein